MVEDDTTKPPKEIKKPEEQTIEYWKNKYIKLLENYNELLLGKTITIKKSKTK